MFNDYPIKKIPNLNITKLLNYQLLKKLKKKIMSNIFSDGSTVIERIVEDKSHKITNTQEEIESFYEIERTVDALIKEKFEKIALQFPDELLADSVKVATTLQKRTNKKFFILADTTYGSCCVDEVAAQHVNAECIIHYGRSCLSPTNRLPVLYIFGKQPIDLKNCLEIFDNFFGIDDNSQKIIIILYDVVYAHRIDELFYKLQQKYSKNTNLIIIKTKTDAKIDFGGVGDGGGGGTLEEEQQSKNESAPLKVQEIQVTIREEIQDEIQGKIQGRSYSLPKRTKIEDCTLFYIGEEGPTLTNILLTHNKCKAYSYNPKIRIGRQENLKVNRALMKRFYMVQKAKDADIVGIVVGTLGVDSYLKIISHLKNLIIQAGKKPYTFVMGKLNVEKMANFMEIDCFVLVACPENSLIDSKEFYRPIVTPFELEIALDSSKQWTGEYILEFRQLLLSSEEIKKNEINHDYDGGDDNDEPHYSLISGELKKGRKYAIIKNNEDNKDNKDGVTDLTLRDKNTSVSTVLNSAAGEFLNSIRTFKGLEQNIGNSSVQLVEEGRTGIAKGYVNEDNEEGR
ncbi:hypothetical protein Glove_245g24 [Diversispora epigaea]|uniref:2-(3-amino-3-carboxypropyl)histidine synthase subunit 2 n=1 Tax=Diversispora epigaea TaxID=1348612 RepID=A0A397I8P7_9GLOM|nr:hypothetical protein Glove_245g24 [Diversispora epigaea]